MGIQPLGCINADHCAHQSWARCQDQVPGTELQEWAPPAQSLPTLHIPFWGKKWALIRPDCPPKNCGSQSEERQKSRDNTSVHPGQETNLKQAITTESNQDKAPRGKAPAA